jgi:hypothetical protein
MWLFYQAAGLNEDQSSRSGDFKKAVHSCKLRRIYAEVESDFGDCGKTVNMIIGCLDFEVGVVDLL